MKNPSQPPPPPLSTQQPDTHQQNTVSADIKHSPSSSSSSPSPEPAEDTMRQISRRAVFLKHFSLVVLVVQNTTLVLVMRYSRTVDVDGHKYLPTTAVVMSELVKLLTCTMMVFHGVNWDLRRASSQLSTEIIQKPREMMKVAVPSILYTFQNNLLYLALTYLDAATFQVTYQLKILTTAVFSVLILHRSLSLTKWISLVLLTIAVAMVQVSNVKHSDGDKEEDKSDPTGAVETAESASTAVTGLLAVICASVTSGLAGVYTEKILKGSDTSMWIRNIQLALFSLVIGLFGVFVSDHDAVMEFGFFQGYSSVVVLVIFLQALGGIVVAAVMKYADNILKGFASALSIVLSSIISYFLLSDFYPSLSFLVGVMFLLVSTGLYNYPSVKSSSSSSSKLPFSVHKPPRTL